MIGYLWKFGKKTRLWFSTLRLTGSASRELAFTGLAGLFFFFYNNTTSSICQAHYGSELLVTALRFV
jgi:hypothetical protein